MRRGFFLLSTSMFIILMSCDKVSDTQYPDKYPIELGVEWSSVASENLSHNDSRAIEVTEQNISDFGVLAYYEDGSFNAASSTPNFMDNVKVRKSGSQWVYNPLMYWPVSGTVSFFAYAPFDVSDVNYLSVSTLGMPTYTYTQPNVVKSQRDLLLSYPMIDKTKSDVNANNKLPLKFRHALSSVVFKAYVMLAQTDPVKVTSITLQSLRNKKKASFIAVPINETYPHGWQLSWSDVADYTDNNYDLSIANGCLYDTDIKNNTAPINISTVDGQLMILPQIIDDTDKIIVMTTIGSETKTKEISLKSIIPVFETGKRYTISIKIVSKVDVDIICTVAPWKINVIDVPEFN